MTNLPRRSLLAAPLFGLIPAAQATAAPFTLPPTLPATLAELERRHGGRLGVAALDTATGQLLGHRSDERFALCSTFKLLLAAAVLQQIDADRFAADHWVPFEGATAVPNSPVTDAHRAAGGMTALALAHATQTTSDNLAANLLMQLLGGTEGPQWLTQWLRTHGDPTTRLDRWEPEMNNVPAGEVRDTSSPAAIARTTAHLLTSNVLKPASRELLLQWMVDTRTGLQRLRAGLPQGWRAGDKTGTGWRAGQPDKINDVAITWPPGQAPWVIAAYYEARLHQEAKLRERDVAVLAAVGRAVRPAVR